MIPGTNAAENDGKLALSKAFVAMFLSGRFAVPIPPLTQTITVWNPAFNLEAEEAFPAYLDLKISLFRHSTMSVWRPLLSFFTAVWMSSRTKSSVASMWRPVV